jgi:multiple sugar transport system permease protein
MWSPFVMLMLMAGLQGIPANLVEAAQVDRATPWQRFRAVIYPSIRGVLLLAILFRLIESFNQFDLVYTITNGGPGTSTETLSTEIYDTAFVLFQTGRSSALANLSVFVIMVLVQIYFQALRQADPAYVAAWELERQSHPPAQSWRWSGWSCRWWRCCWWACRICCGTCASIRAC